MSALRLGTRGSPLALAQAALATEALTAIGIATETVIITTHGDRETDAALGDLGPGAFASALEEALLAGDIDVAVHSAKDLTGALPAELDLAAFLPRADPRDAWCGAADSLAAVPVGARVGTSSLRRGALLRIARPDLEIVPIRGNVGTRLEAIGKFDLDGVVLAACGLDRLGLHERIGFRLPVEQLIPEAGQGAIALQVRAADTARIAAADDPITRLAVTAERTITRRLGGGCRVPVAAHVYLGNDDWCVGGFVGSDDPDAFLIRTAVGDDPLRLASSVAESLLAAGGEALLEGAQR